MKKTYFSCLLIPLAFHLAYGYVDLSNFFPYGPSNGDTNMTRSDDGSSNTITTSINFPFFGFNYTSLWVNVNGAISFRTPISEFIPSCSPLNASFSMVAPYWADVDISTTGMIYYRQDTNPTNIKKAENEIYNAFPNITQITIKWLLITTWYNVTYYPDNLPDYYYRKRDTFQAILATNGAQSFAIFYYNNITWTTGDASGGTNGLGGTQAFAGFDAGDGKNRYTIEGSCTSKIINISDTSDVGKPGVWVFRIDDSIIAPTQPPTSPLPNSVATQASTVPITVPSYSPKPTPSAAPTTPAGSSNSSNPLSNSDGTPCGCNNAGLWLDLLLVIDRSAGVGEDGMTDIAGQLIGALLNVSVAQSGQGDFYTRVGLIVFSSDVIVIGNLTHYTSNDQLTRDLLSLNTYYRGDDNIVDIGKALKQAQILFRDQSSTSARNARKAVVLYASSYSQSQDDAKGIAAQMNASNVFIITVDYHDPSGLATDILGKISTPYMNFSSENEGTLDDVSTGLCYANCNCPSSTLQVKTFNTSTYRQTYYADCLQGVTSGTYSSIAEEICESRNGTLLSLTTPIRQKFFNDVVVVPQNNQLPSSIGSLHIGLHRKNNTQNQWVWYGYGKTEYPIGDYQNWAPGFNSSSAGDAVYIDKLGPNNWKWMTEGSFSNTFMYVCQLRACDSNPTDCDRRGWITNSG